MRSVVSKSATARTSAISQSARLYRYWSARTNSDFFMPASAGLPLRYASDAVWYPFVPIPGSTWRLCDQPFSIAQPPGGWHIFTFKRWPDFQQSARFSSTEIPRPARYPLWINQNNTAICCFVAAELDISTAAVTSTLITSGVHSDRQQGRKAPRGHGYIRGCFHLTPQFGVAGGCSHVAILDFDNSWNRAEQTIRGARSQP